jgi:predicted aldo/keto reductase-like oxidoreductase
MKREVTTKGRRGFIKSGITGLAGASVLPSILKGKEISETKEEVKKGKIIYRTLGKTGIKVPIVSMGVMNADNPNLVKAALDAGMIHLDTAHYYQRGRNEEMVGEVVKDLPRDSYVVATKVPGFHEDRKTGALLKDVNTDNFLKMFDISLKRLKMDYVDILYLHSVKSKEGVLFEPYIKIMEKLKKQGKIKFAAISTHKNEPDVIRATADSKFYDIVLTAYNFKQKNREEVKKAMDYAAKAGIGIVAMKTQAGVYWDEKTKKQPINMKAALKWALQDENVHTSIPGFTTYDQMNLDLSVMEDLILTPKEIEDLKFGEKQKLTGLYCQQCDTCLSQCRNNLDIPTLMRSYMYAYGYKNLSEAKLTLESLNLSDMTCGDCTTCQVNCPNGFDVKTKIQDIARLRDVPQDFLV